MSDEEKSEMVRTRTQIATQLRGKGPASSGRTTDLPLGQGSSVEGGGWVPLVAADDGSGVGAPVGGSEVRYVKNPSVTVPAHNFVCVCPKLVPRLVSGPDEMVIQTVFDALHTDAFDRRPPCCFQVSFDVW